MGSSVAIEGVTVLTPAGEAIVPSLSLTIAGGEAVALIGRSGAGKSTILRLINGLARPAAGAVSIDGEIVAGNLAVRRRAIGTILQAPALFPHRTVYENVATVPRLLQWDESRTRAGAAAVLDGLELPFARFASRFPRSLSGGEQQRVAIARATIAGPSLLLCDEPFSALDPLVRSDLQKAFVRQRDRNDVTMLFVTHDLAEAVRVARRIVLIDGGSVVCDAASDDFLRSDLPLVRRFVEAARL